MANEINKIYHSQEQINYCLDLYKSGLSSCEISRRTNIHNRTIWHWIKKSGISRGRFGSTLRHKIEVKLGSIELYKTGKTYKEVAKHFSIKYPTIGKWIREAGVSRGKTGACGERNYFWEGGKTPKNTKIRNSKQYDLWRISVLERDNFICQCCSKIGGNLHVHHILTFSKYTEKRFDVNNGITLCRKCHSILHGRNVGFIKRA